jgi:hypothetical protein
MCLIGLEPLGGLWILRSNFELWWGNQRHYGEGGGVWLVISIDDVCTR